MDRKPHLLDNPEVGISIKPLQKGMQLMLYLAEA